MKAINRRSFVKTSLAAAAAFSLPSPSPAQARRAGSAASARRDAFIIDTNVDRFGWPFRTLKHGDTAQLVAKLRKHAVKQAWAGSFESLLHKNIDHVNARLTEECRGRGEGMLLPFGTVNPMFPDWEEDLRRCHEVYKMPGIRLYPNYHGYTLDNPVFKALVGRATERGLRIQMILDMEDERMQHPLVNVPPVDPGPLPEVLQAVPRAKLMLINAYRPNGANKFKLMVEGTDVLFEISNFEATAAVGLLLAGKHWSRDVVIPLERLTFGSHFPFFPLENALFKLIESPLSQEQIDAITHRNAERFLSA